jgi:hypothetical protein
MEERVRVHVPKGSLQKSIIAWPSVGVWVVVFMSASLSC